MTQVLSFSWILEEWWKTKRIFILFFPSFFPSFFLSFLLSFFLSFFLSNSFFLILSFFLSFFPFFLSFFFSFFLSTFFLSFFLSFFLFLPSSLPPSLPSFLPPFLHPSFLFCLVFISSLLYDKNFFYLFLSLFSTSYSITIVISKSHPDFGLRQDMSNIFFYVAKGLPPQVKTRYFFVIF